MANEITLAKAARSIARELFELPEGSEFPFGTGRVFHRVKKAPCCAVGHVIHRAGLSDLVKDHVVEREWIASSDAVREVLGEDGLPTEVWKALAEVVGANDDRQDAQAVGEWLYVLADALELAAGEAA